MMIKIGVIGLGVIAKYYISAFPESRTAKLTAVCDLQTEKTDPFSKTDVRVYQEYRSLLNDPNVEAVVINLPNDLHFDVCREALLKGKHVCCEKPLTLNMEEAIILQNTSKQAGKTLFTAFHRRYNQPLIDLKSQVGPLSEVAQVDLYYNEKIEDHAGNDTWYLDPTKCGGGCVADNGPNAFDTLAWLIGPLSVTRASIVRDDRNIDIEAEVELRNDQGLTATTYLDWAYPHGEDKRVVYTMKDGRQLTGDMLQGSVSFKSSLFHEYARVIDDFAVHIQENRGQGEEGQAAVALVNHCYQIDEQEVTHAVV
ncbi:Gfo/Idh/MocA family protein [Reinekea forsetii]|mgnify:CR=1 FL=1|jgi:predicted dehydrogenase|nr:Gfo/Idh/MocA family oxidoreductase [Reinekea forsetii]